VGQERWWLEADRRIAEAAAEKQADEALQQQEQQRAEGQQGQAAQQPQQQGGGAAAALEAALQRYILLQWLWFDGACQGYAEMVGGRGAGILLAGASTCPGAVLSSFGMVVSFGALRCTGLHTLTQLEGQGGST